MHTRCSLIAGFITLASTLVAKELTLCIEDRANLDGTVSQIFRDELVSLVPVRFAPCPSAEVRLTIEAKPAPEHDGALGAARRSGDRIEPDLYVFVEPVSRLLYSRLPYYVGKALARVASHELAHYLKQQGRHEHDGVLTAYLTPGRLMAADSSSFRVRPGR